MDLEVERLRDVRSKSDHRGVESLKLTDHQPPTGRFRRGDHFVCFSEGRRDRFFYENVNTLVEERARDLTVGLGWSRDRDGVNAVEKMAAVTRKKLTFRSSQKSASCSVCQPVCSTLPSGGRSALLTHSRCDSQT